jgi:hypothetical protein
MTSFTPIPPIRAKGSGLRGPDPFLMGIGALLSVPRALPPLMSVYAFYPSVLDRLQQIDVIPSP